MFHHSTAIFANTLLDKKPSCTNLCGIPIPSEAKNSSSPITAVVRKAERKAGPLSLQPRLPFNLPDNRCKFIKERVPHAFPLRSLAWEKKYCHFCPFLPA